MSQATQASSEIGTEVSVITLRTASSDGSASTLHCSIEVTMLVKICVHSWRGGGVFLDVHILKYFFRT
jgi:hypothetical protein